MKKPTDEWVMKNPDYTCPCGLYVHPAKRNPKAIHMVDCPFFVPADKAPP